MELSVWNDFESLKIEPLNENAPAVFKDVVSKLQYYWVSAGTALGLYRDKDFIPGDTDLDFALIGYDGVMSQIINALDGYKLVRSIICEGKPMQLAFMKDGVLVDIYFHYLCGDKYENYSESGKQTMLKEIYENLETRETKYDKVSFVKDMDKYLITRYGDDWKIPSDKKPKFETF